MNSPKIHAFSNLLEIAVCFIWQKPQILISCVKIRLFDILVRFPIKSGPKIPQISNFFIFSKICSGREWKNRGNRLMVLKKSREKFLASEVITFVALIFSFLNPSNFSATGFRKLQLKFLLLLHFFGDYSRVWRKIKKFEIRVFQGAQKCFLQQQQKFKLRFSKICR